jgi:hypothetical protein
MITLTIPIVISSLTLILAYAVFQFGLFRWLIGRIDLLGSNFKDELVRHQQTDLEALKEIRSEILGLATPKRTRKLGGR